MMLGTGFLSGGRMMLGTGFLSGDRMMPRSVCPGAAG